MFQISWINIKSALVYGVLSAILMMALYAISIGDVFALDMKALVNAGVFGFITVLTSLIKNLLTTDEGKFIGVVKVIPPTE
jgi:hypothetical protein